MRRHSGCIHTVIPMLARHRLALSRPRSRSSYRPSTGCRPSSNRLQRGALTPELRSLAEAPVPAGYASQHKQSSAPASVCLFVRVMICWSVLKHHNLSRIYYGSTIRVNPGRMYVLALLFALLRLPSLLRCISDTVEHSLSPRR